MSDEERKKVIGDQNAADESDSANEELEEGRPLYEFYEIDFDFNEYVSRYTRPQVVDWQVAICFRTVRSNARVFFYRYVFALRDFETNSLELNNSILKMLHRFAFQLALPSKLYLVSCRVCKQDFLCAHFKATFFHILFKLHQLMRKVPKTSIKEHRFYSLYEFGYYLLRKFFVSFQSRGDILICELLFTKSNDICVDIEQGYGYAK